MKLRLHHMELCVKDPTPVVKLLCNQFGLNLVGYRESPDCIQVVLKLSKTAFIVTSRKGFLHHENNNNFEFLGSSDETFKNAKLSQDPNEHWTFFCCSEDQGKAHVDSVFNVAVEVTNLVDSVQKAREGGAVVVQDIRRVDTGSEGHVDFAVIKSCCGNVVHTLIQKDGFSGWFLPGFNRLNTFTDVSDPSAEIYNVSHINGITMSHFDHFTLACRVGETNGIIEWYEKVFGMNRFITNRTETEEEGLVIGDDIGLRLKVMEFWKCSEAGLASQDCNDGDWEPLKIVIAESLPNMSNTQIEGFLKDHGGPGVQHVGLHTDNMVDTVRELKKQGVRFRFPPPTYYTEIGQLNVIKAVGEDVDELRKYGILLDNEADVFETDYNPSEERFLMQVFTHPVFDRDTFFLEVIQRRGARGFGVGNVTALARSVNAYKKEKLLLKQKQMEAEEAAAMLSVNSGINEGIIMN